MGFSTGKEWKTEELEFVKENVNKMSDKDLGEALGRSTSSIIKKRSTAGIKRTVRFPGEREMDDDIDMSEYPEHIRLMILKKTGRM